jgi:hypothetical protein
MFFPKNICKILIQLIMRIYLRAFDKLKTEIERRAQGAA